jgi:hypothetical protein
LLLAESTNLAKAAQGNQAETRLESLDASEGIPARLISALRAADPFIERVSSRLQAAKPLWSAVIVIVALALIIGLAGYSISTAVPLQVEITDLSMNADLSQIDQMEIRVTNTMTRAITPQVAVGRVGWQPYPWDIIRGPEMLAPGESGLYWVRTDVDYRIFRLDEGAQVTISDASGDYAVRGATRIRTDIYTKP